MQNMIPKTIHYCWFGGNPLPELAVKCIDSWRKFCPDYEIKEWNESNFDLNCCDYVREAYEAKKWAFITDYVRLYALVNEGGIYMDTDVEVVKPLDRFLSEQAFSGFESETQIPTGIMACQKGFPLFEKLLKEYEHRHFMLADGKFDMTTNVITITETCLMYGLKQNNHQQIINGFSLYPKDWFCPKDYVTGNILQTENTHTIHHFSGTWQDQLEHKITNRERYFIRKFGPKKGRFLGRRATSILRFQRKFRKLGLKGTLLFIIRRH